jgi:hypothetical protein
VLAGEGEVGLMMGKRYACLVLNISNSLGTIADRDDKTLMGVTDRADKIDAELQPLRTRLDTGDAVRNVNPLGH